MSERDRERDFPWKAHEDPEKDRWFTERRKAGPTPDDKISVEVNRIKVGALNAKRDEMRRQAEDLRRRKMALILNKMNRKLRDE